jgi:hypothetical protein
MRLALGLVARFVPVWATSSRRLGAGLALLLAACGGAGEVPRTGGFIVTAAPPGPGGFGGPGALPTPPPAPPRTPVWNANAASLERTPLFGAFASDMDLVDDVLFVVDADQIEQDGARIVPWSIGGAAPTPSTRHVPTVVRAADLVDGSGAAADLANPIGFGFYLNDLEVVDDELGFVLVNAGGSDSAPPLSNLIVFDPTNGLVRQVVNLARAFTDLQPLLDSTGAPAAGNTFTQAGAESLAFVPAPGGGSLFVGMTNLLVNAPSYGGTKQRGTIQVFDVVRGDPQPVRARPAPGLFTETLLTTDYNPVAMEVLTTDEPLLDGSRERLLVTLGGTTTFDIFFRIAAVSDSSVEVYDARTSSYAGRFVLGLAGLAGTPPALGRDGAGNRLGFFPSAVTGEVYVLRLDGLYSASVDVSRLAVLRGVANGIPVTPEGAGGPGGNLAGIALTPDGRTLLVTSFGDLFAFPAPVPGQLRALSLPQNLVATPAFPSSLIPGTALYASESGRTLGRVLLRPNDLGLPDAFVLVSGTIDLTTYTGSSPASIGTLTTFGLVR